MIFGAAMPVEGKAYSACVKKWKDSMTEAYKVAHETSYGVAEESKTGYNKKGRRCVLEEGDRVLVRNLREKEGPGKLRSYW